MKRPTLHLVAMPLVAMISAALTCGCAGPAKNTASTESVAATDQPAAKQVTVSNHQRFVGTWSMDIDKMIAMTPGMADELERNPDLRANIESVMRTARFEFTQTDVRLNMGNKVDHAVYTVRSDSGDQLVIESRDDGSESVEVITATFSSDDVMVLTKEGTTDKIPLIRQP